MGVHHEHVGDPGTDRGALEGLGGVARAEQVTDVVGDQGGDAGPDEHRGQDTSSCPRRQIASPMRTRPLSSPATPATTT